MIDDEKDVEIEEQDASATEEPAVAEIEPEADVEPPQSESPDKPDTADAQEDVAVQEAAEQEPEEDSEQEAEGDSDGLENVDLSGVDDPLAPAYDLEEGRQFESFEEGPVGLPSQTKVESAKEFFNTEILYRFDIIEPAELEPIKGSYLINLKGTNGGVWTLKIGDQLEVTNTQEEADTILEMLERDFLEIVNGKLNPQLSILSQKIKVKGAVKQAIRLQEILAPRPE